VARKSKLEEHRSQIEEMDRSGIARAHIADNFGVTPGSITHFLGSKRPHKKHEATDNPVPDVRTETTPVE